MSGLKTAATLAATLAALCPLAAQAAPARLAYNEDASSLPSLKNQAATLATVASDSFDVSLTGQVSGAIPVVLRSIAGAHGIVLLPVVSNYGTGGFSAKIAEAVLPAGPAQDRAITGLLKLAGGNLAGINLDFENVPHRLRADYTAFVGRLAAGLHAAGKTLVLSLPATTSGDPSESWTGAFDYAALGRHADTLQVMTYDENGPWGSPGPVAGLDWVTACLAYAHSVVPAPKISLGMPAYGYDWNLTAHSGVTVGWKAIPALLARTQAQPKWDAAASSPWFRYTATNGSAHVVWYENARSTGLKARLAAQGQVASVSVWVLGLDDESYWRAITAGFAASTR